MADLHAPKTQLQLYLGARKVISKDTFSKSDPFCVLYEMGQGGAKKMVGITESKKDNDNPDFDKSFSVTYYFEEQQTYRIECYDADSKNLQNLSEHDFIGYIDFTLGKLVASRGSTIQELMTKQDGSKRSKSVLVVRSEEVQGANDYVNIHISCTQLVKMGWFANLTDSYIEVFGSTPTGRIVSVCRTDVMRGSLNPNFRPLRASVAALCGGNMDKIIILKLFHDNDGNPKGMGEVAGSLRDFLADGPAKKYTIRKPKDKHIANPRNRGEMHILFTLERMNSFLDYIQGGLQIHLTIAVDYTASNQDPRSPNSLHFMDGRMNHYQNAMATIGNIVMDYTTTASVAALGFGAKLLNEQKGVNHCFPLTFDPNNPFVNGVNGMLGAYAHSFGQLRLSGPTYFSDIINCASGLATSLPYSASEQHYSILLILTDGIINDMPKTISSIVAASDKPLSIIIVGVGNGADWAAMEELDGDGKMLQAPTGQYALRDIVQFVPMEKCLRMGLPALARETLAEVPNQVTSFMRLHKISPIPARPPAPALFSPGTWMRAPGSIQSQEEKQAAGPPPPM